MYVTRRLKPDGPWPGLAYPLVIGPSILVTAVIGGPELLFPVAGALALVGAIYTFVFSYLKTRSWPTLVAVAYQLSVAVLCFSVMGPVLRGRKPSPIHALPLIFVIPLGITIAALVISKKGKWRGRELLELAAQPVEASTVVGYTSRPRPVGTVDITPRELEAFTDFVKRETIALPRQDGNRTVFVLVQTGHEPAHVLGMRDDLEKETWVAIDDEGNVSAHIAMREYMLYREDLDFDELCVSLGQVFIDFLELYREGRSVRIMDRLNAMPVGFMS